MMNWGPESDHADRKSPNELAMSVEGFIIGWGG